MSHTRISLVTSLSCTAAHRLPLLHTLLHLYEAVERVGRPVLYFLPSLELQARAVYVSVYKKAAAENKRSVQLTTAHGPTQR